MTPLSRLFRHCAQGALFLCLTSCSAHPDAVRIIMRGESVTLSAPGITIHLDGAMHLAVQRSIDGQARPLARPAATHYVMVNGTVIDIFNREPGQPDESDAVTTFGNTHHVTFVGINTTPGGSPLQKFHTFLFPSRYPGLVLNQVSYRNLGTADILIAAIGSPRFVTADMVKPGAVVIDVGMNRVDGKFVGDVDFDAVCEVASAITPVPGGVGPMTIAMLLCNTLTAAQLAAR